MRRYYTSDALREVADEGAKPRLDTKYLLGRVACPAFPITGILQPLQASVSRGARGTLEQGVENQSCLLAAHHFIPLFHSGLTCHKAPRPFLVLIHQIEALDALKALKRHPRA